MTTTTHRALTRQIAGYVDPDRRLDPAMWAGIGIDTHPDLWASSVREHHNITQTSNSNCDLEIGAAVILTDLVTTTERWLDAHLNDIAHILWWAAHSLHPDNKRTSTFPNSNPQQLGSAAATALDQLSCWNFDQLTADSDPAADHRWHTPRLYVISAPDPTGRGGCSCSPAHRLVGISGRLTAHLYTAVQLHQQPWRDHTVGYGIAHPDDTTHLLHDALRLYDDTISTSADEPIVLGDPGCSFDNVLGTVRALRTDTPPSTP
jgi:hypothetical protein